MIAATVADLNKDFPVGDESIRVLHDISAEIRMGALTRLVGPSGCGKTMLLSILSASSGRIDLMGTALDGLSDKQKTLFRRTHIGFIFQQYN